MSEKAAQFHVGQLVLHRMFGYRGVIVDVDADFQLGDEWYDQVARSRPPKDEPWYHVLPDGAAHMTYVAQRNLQADPSTAPIRHPLVDAYLGEFRDGGYLPLQRPN